MGFIWSLIIGGILGWIASLITGRDIPGGVFGNIIAGIIGAWLGTLILGQWGPVMGGFYIVPALIGAIVLILVVSFVMRSMRRNTKSAQS
ncbi:GlsB/YeaQ/YmgE family stress response membrane protein [Oceanobacillus profundus]|uniref:GlsB/YeaQ/YmgE family stress response membrane protein n=1 Tax=Oceanobacillus profundus TaxID=372463 RepID=A0A417YMG2_9BACI|nr:GlsB/YeaQ/YmgE family stress response membrane protein [Oceanobacillus profundus]MBR3120488.1 GlsB/YeaQ/YmgE family stress response membrane protein [Oceanobacillus sp.]PAE29595.1 GlsB/YeaQ/YmgE family stress response membrane protein [Paenibacillus sp. 7884-2]MCM3399153.1 GlsB/YeaQ/YmgE family stress response membrane protein [Oceanobacillus profundus]MDO6449175.1 GlsB/YeaQ/YmgE family stress response membrane protein [Oceanobacillus profundus]RHW34495.1 GlsB/YeaQ/YmgE family stress respon